MAQIVCTKEARVELCEVGDIVAIHDDDAQLTGKGYANLTIYNANCTAAHLHQKLDALLPDFQTIDKKMYYLNNSTWVEIKVLPKYDYNISVLTAAELAALQSPEKIVVDAAIEKVRVNVTDKNPPELKIK